MINVDRNSVAKRKAVIDKTQVYSFYETAKTRRFGLRIRRLQGALEDQHLSLRFYEFYVRLDHQLCANL